MKKVLFIDRDGTIIKEPEDEQIDSLEKLEFLPGVITNLSRIANELDFELVIVSNQDGLGTDSFPKETFWPAQNKMLGILEGEGIHFSEILIDPSFPEDNSPGRKPGTAMLTHYLKGAEKGMYDLENSYVIGDRYTDVQLAQNLGCKAIYISDDKTLPTALTTENWKDIYQFLQGQPRKGKIERRTSETQIMVEVNLNGSGKSNISTGLGFFDHMLDQLARHGGIDLNINVSGDLEIDEHHTIEDTGLALGEAFLQALGSKKGIQRYGFLLPMDDCLAQVAIDFGGRPWMMWEVDFKREKIGEMPTEMFSHFFKSFSDTAKCNLNIKAEGENEHHKIEAIYKACAKAIRMAIKQTDNFSVPSTKGVL
ncbi:bifunctional histidinol-phosphatase/imidazoleglycerol-phosphate dehydratase HisB [Xanthovirga aplysinae]|uniref:bifunctional histidinol-phosphatase/imidazoleglycerol-phosphate dehydratase HisB n=1 Tax=Xanthovirga aplysinae TaxID=2529853 RepID=UPI0012BBE1F2|nr:bifunctional histidinol-phosphatase/imidazoleglycerol-phosphate dehydratase HisB [Xanthovirga aplysinae]MTI32219.1 bifunctional histidinol-phosphatase/imidazoleglycerol-phosphate dehydratase HisB [Xanthovirga aplysinae]